MSTLTLYVDSNFTSPYAMSVFVTLIEKKLPFEMHKIDLDAGENLRAPYRDLGMSGRVPTLVHGDLVLTESSAITEYLEECFGAPAHPPVLPTQLHERALARQVQAWVRSDLMPIREERSTGVIFFKPSDQPLSAAGKHAAERLIRIAERLIDGPNLFAQWCIADTDLALMLNRLIANGDPVPQKLKHYVAGQWQRDAVQQWVNQPRR